MLRIQMIGLALVAALAMSAVAAGSASAAHEWLINGSPIAAAKKIHSKGLLLLTDHNPLNINNSTIIHCKGFDAGTVGPGAADLVESITAELLGTNPRITCTFDKAGGCDAGTAPLALAVHLPWRTELYLVGTEVRDMIVPDGTAGNPGWKVVCKNALIGTIVDECTSALGSVGLDNVAGGVEGLFEKNSENADCSVNGETLRKGAGLVRGSTLFENPGAGEKLSFL